MMYCISERQGDEQDAEEQGHVDQAQDGQEGGNWQPFLKSGAQALQRQLGLRIHSKVARPNSQ
jgi:hypothetical protein